MTNTPPATIHLGDCIEVMSTLPENSVDAIVTDPPYGLGFMGKAWDELPPGEEWARECLRVLKPGGHLLAFGGSRTWHRLAVAVEDAGFEMRDSIAWLYGSGFPKSLDVSKAIDKAAPRVGMPAGFAAHYAERRKAKGLSHAQVCEAGGFYANINHGGASVNWERGHNVPTPEQWEILSDLLDIPREMWADLIARVEAERVATGRHLNGITTGDAGLTAAGDGKERRDIPATPAAQQWQGWGTALKPAFEPIVVARKPLAGGTVAANVLAHGTGALNIDGCRVEGVRDRTDYGLANATRSHGATYGKPTAAADFDASKGRWPANVVLDESQAAALDQMSGPLHTQDPATRYRKTDPSWSPSGTSRGTHREQKQATGGLSEKGTGASRFFPVFKGDEEDALSVLEAAIDNATDTCRCGHGADHCNTCAARAVLALGEPAATFRYQAKAPTSERIKVDGVAHPTVKPLALMRWLVRLVTPPGGTVLEPFAGSGTTVEACALEGFACVAIEREPDYLPLIQARLARVEAAQPEPAGPSLFDIEATA